MECLEICTNHTNYRIHCDDDGWALGVSTEYCLHQSFIVYGDKKQRREMSRLKDKLEGSQHVNVHWELQRRHNVKVHRQNTTKSWPKPISFNTNSTDKVNSDFYEHYVHILDSKKMDKMVLRGDMDITFAGLVDKGK